MKLPRFPNYALPLFAPRRLQTGMRGAYGKPQGLAARVKIGQILISCRARDGNEHHIQEAFRKCKFKVRSKSWLPYHLCKVPERHHLTARRVLSLCGAARRKQTPCDNRGLSICSRTPCSLLRPVAQKHSTLDGCPLLTHRTILSYPAQFPGRQLIITSKKHGFTTVTRENYQKLRDAGKLVADGVSLKVLNGSGPLAFYKRLKVTDKIIGHPC